MDLRASRILSVCTGTGMLDVGVRVAIPSARVVCCVEHEAYAAHLLASRMEEEVLGPAPVWTNLHTFHGAEWRGRLDGIIGGYPCQPFSVAGKRLGDKDPRHLWPSLRGIIRDGEVGWCFFENVPGHVNQGLREVLQDLESLGFRVVTPEGEPTFGLFSAEEVGASHKRERLFILAYRTDAEWWARKRRAETGTRPKECGRRRSPVGGGALADPGSGRRSGAEPIVGEGCGAPREEWGQQANGLEGLCGVFAPGPGNLRIWGRIVSDGSLNGLAPATQPGVRMLADGVALVVDESRRDQLRAIGNGVVPLQAAYALSVLARRAGLILE